MRESTHIRSRAASSKRQRGFTLLEVLVSVGIMGSLGGVLATSSFIMLKAQRDTNSHAQVAIEVSKSTRWLVRDIHRAGSSDLVDSAAAVDTASFTWLDSGVPTTCTFDLNGGDSSLERTCGGSVSKIATGVSGVQFIRTGDLISASYTVTSPLDPTRTENVEILVVLGGA